MPRLTACIRCGSILDAGDAVDVVPPRAPRGPKHLRPTRRRFRRLNERLWTRRWRPDPGALRTGGLATAYIGSVLLPVLPYWIEGRRRAFVVASGVWLGLLLAALFFLGTSFGNLCWGLAIGAHATILMHGTGLSRGFGVRGRVVASLAIIAVFWFLYGSAARLVAGSISGAYASMSYPAQNIQLEDLVVGRHAVLQSGTLLPRGTIVFGRFAFVERAGGGAAELRRPGNQLALGQVIGYSGETVEVTDSGFRVDGEALDPEAFPLPSWLIGRDVSITVPDGHHFVTTGYRMNGTLELSSHIIEGILLLPHDRVTGKASLRWLPVRRRGMLPQ